MPESSSNALPPGVRPAGAIPGRPWRRDGGEAWPDLDRDVLMRARAGEPAALGAFFDACFDRLYALAHRFTGRRESAEDILQEVFLKLRRGLGRVDLDRDLAPWLYTVTLNACRDHRRSAWWRFSRRSVDLDEALEGAAPTCGAGEPEQTLMRREERRRVQRAVAMLPEPFRVSILLHDFEGLPHENIARLAGISHEAARQRHVRALRALAAILAAEERA